MENEAKLTKVTVEEIASIKVGTSVSYPMVDWPACRSAQVTAGYVSKMRGMKFTSRIDMSTNTLTLTRTA